ncbi:MAG: hypothetical protein O7A64_01540, partial [Alphaproteobacteria bacterium]|nr:hypothetical protein [Alphaproteobacteria bacterium]
GSAWLLRPVGCSRRARRRNLRTTPAVPARYAAKTRTTRAAAGLEWAPVARLLKAQRRGMRAPSLKIWALLVLDAWRRAA